MHYTSNILSFNGEVSQDLLIIGQLFIDRIDYCICAVSQSQRSKR